MSQSLDVIAFDLDDTLYDEGQYFAAAFEAVAQHLSRSAGADRGDVLRRLNHLLRAKGRSQHRLFNDLLGQLKLDEKAHLPALLEIFRGVRPRLTPFPGVERLLRGLACRYRLGLITSGMRAVQQNKIKLLGLTPFFEHVVYSSTLPENKPGRMPYRRLLDALKAAPERAAYVGDNPFVDFKGANELGMLTVRVRSAAFEGAAVPPGHDARLRVENAAELQALFLSREAP